MNKKLVTSADYFVKDGKPVITLRLTDSDGDADYFYVDGCRPYFYVPAGEVECPNGIYESIYGKKVTKVYVDLPSDVRDKRTEYSTSYESDIPFPLRFLIDNKIRSGVVINEDGNLTPVDVTNKEITPTKLFIDIETEVKTDEVDIDPDKTDNRILTIVCTYVNDNKGIKETTVLHDRDEINLLADFIYTVNDYDPDMILAWYIYFDMGNIYNRCEKLGVDLSDISPLRSVYKRGYGNRREVVCKGRLMIDLKDAYLNYYKNINHDSSRLEDVCKKELGIEKSDFDYKKMVDGEWQKHIGEIKKYNVLDVERMVRLDEKIGIVNHFEELRRTTGCYFVDAYRVTGYFDALLLREYNDMFVLPMKTKKTKTDFRGGLVLLFAKPGVHEYVAFLDFHAHYPTGVKNYNISPETIRDSNWGNVNEVETDIGTVYFAKEPRGVLPKIFDIMGEERTRLKRKRDSYPKNSEEWKLYDLKQYIRKQIINGGYGYFVYPGSRLYIPKLGSAVTAVGRMYIQDSVKFVEDNFEGIIVKYTDTDSMALSIPGASDADVVKKAKEIEEAVNIYWEERSIKEGLNGRPIIECEKLFKKVFYPYKKNEDRASKKKYAGRICWEKGKFCDEISVTGFELVKSDSSEATKEVQRGILNIVLDDLNLGKMHECLRHVDEKIRAPRCVKDIGEPKTIGMNPEDYEVPMSVHEAIWSNQNLGKEFGKKEKRAYSIYLKGIPEGYNDTVFVPKRKGEVPETRKISRIALSENDDINKWIPFIDFDMHSEKQIKEKVETILEGVGYSFSEVWNNQKQTRLFSF